MYKTLPAKELSCAFRTRNTLLPSDFSFTLSCMRKNAGRGEKGAATTMNPPRVFPRMKWVDGSDGTVWRCWHQECLSYLRRGW